jgi:hypothetical protein
MLRGFAQGREIGFTPLTVFRSPGESTSDEKEIVEMNAINQRGQLFQSLASEEEK